MQTRRPAKYMHDDLCPAGRANSSPPRQHRGLHDSPHLGTWRSLLWFRWQIDDTHYCVAKLLGALPPAYPALRLPEAPLRRIVVAAEVCHRVNQVLGMRKAEERRFPYCNLAKYWNITAQHRKPALESLHNR